MDHELDDEGTTWNQRARQAAPERMSPRQAWRAIMRQMPQDASWHGDWWGQNWVPFFLMADTVDTRQQKLIRPLRA